MDVIAAPLEIRMIADIRRNIKIARRAAVLSDVAFTGDANTRMRVITLSRCAVTPVP